MRVTVNKDELEKTGDNIIDYANDFKFQIESIKKLIATLENSWQGTDMKVFVDEMNNRYIPKLEDLRNELIKCGRFLKEVKKDYETLDEPLGGA